MGLPSTPRTPGALPSCWALAFAGAGRRVAHQEKPVSSQEGNAVPSHLPDVLVTCVRHKPSVSGFSLPHV